MVFTMPNMAFSAPWAHGERFGDTHLDSEVVDDVGGGIGIGSIVEELKSFSLEISDEESNEGGENRDFGERVLLPWEREVGLVGERERQRSNAELAEKMVPEDELKRLRSLALRMKERMKIGEGGITQVVVDGIHERWKEAEVVKLKFEGSPALNMKRTHEILERKTGGLVIWRSGSSVVLYRGMAYKLPCVQSYSMHIDSVAYPSSNDSTSAKLVHDNVKSNDVDVKKYFKDPSAEFVDTEDIDNFLDELGPRFTDWSGCNPLPVDADLLPCVVPGYRPPFRYLPHRTRWSLRDKDMTTLRRLARTVPPHFALGRNRQHQGLARAMMKLWERSSIAKIAIKRGIPNTSNERMAEELKRLTGGTLLSRNKDFIVFYRGKDFLTPAVTKLLAERQKLATVNQDEEEQARLWASESIVSNIKAAKGPLVAGTLAETIEANSRWGKQIKDEDREKMLRDNALCKHVSLVRYLERKLVQAQEKVRKAEKALSKVQESLNPAELPSDLEIITDEERFLFRQVGLKMKSFLVLGRRGVFDGTVQNMHLSWKHRELVKIFVKGKNFAQVKHIAISLEAESGGVLISLDKTTQGYAIIVYRGKNYHRPSILRPKNLLTKRQALTRSIELQRREALNHHIFALQGRIETLKSELDQMEAVKETGNEDLYSRLEGSYSSDDDVEDGGEEAYLQT
ncbi:hypothetical protein QJS10_CPA06g01081 [Acorus calamus]|uniref:CRM-domain containing factor CFM3, chloroplastic/mitochondrial n=1 Tax=Acorus calamus TaxID=4465 RepID=A0AAV9EKT3_ACOCL|nr:hypothetical protein QJS10_CPA06g01081 [Acorus calamus]